MGKNGKLLNLNSDSPKYGNKSLVTKEQENELKRRKITFSFSYFKQIPNFQIGECSKGWHIGLLERLGALGTMTPQEVLEENRGSIALRCHPIDWSAKNIPIQRKDLDWLPKEILDNETDFPIMQFSITKSTGRIVGYFDRDSSIFHIVLLDPEHNIQPAKKTNYQIQPTTKGLSQYDDLLNKLERIKSIVSDCSDKKCKLHSHISVIEELHDNIVYIGLDNDFYSTYQEILKKIPLQKVLIAVCDWCCLPLFGRRLTAVFARGVLCTFWPQKVPKTPRQMPAPTSSRLTLAPGDYSRGRTRPVPFARAFSRAFVSRLRHRAGTVRGNSVFSAGKRSEHANMRTGANISCSRVRGESRHRPWKRF